MGPKRAMLFVLFAVLLVSCGPLALTTAPTPTTAIVVVTSTIPPATQTPYVITATPPPATATLAPTNTPLPTATTLPSPTSAPTAAPSPTSGFKYLPPVITTEAKNITLYPGDIVLTWDFPSQLQDDEWFQVLGWKEIKPERHALTWTKDRSWRFVVNVGNIQMFPWISGLGQYYMAVQVIRGKDGKFMGELSRESAPWPWRW
ncbi:MAG: hypothetical protein KGJ80_13255 [Chloroflexota bacterium]|nr:hypothetical protein [Chloroflexota bacterium]